MCVEGKEVIQVPGGCARVVGAGLLVVVMLAVLVGCVAHVPVGLVLDSEWIEGESEREEK